MVDSAQHHIAKWLTEILKPVIQFYSQYCIGDSFTFANQIQNAPTDLNNSLLHSFDIVYLYTNVPLDETITICADILYCRQMNPTSVPENVFLTLIHIVTKCVQFSFNNKI